MSIMRFLVCTLLCFSFCNLSAEVDSRAYQDTSRANILLKKAMGLKQGTKERIQLLKDAISIYETLPFQKKQIELYGYLSIDYFELNDSLNVAYANKAIKLAQDNQIDELDKCLLNSYIALMLKHTLRDLNLGILYGEKALKIVNKPSNDYFVIMNALIINYRYNEDYDALKSAIEAVESSIEADRVWDDKLPLLYRAKMLQNNLYKNDEKAIIYGKQCLTENRIHHYYDNITAGPIYVELANCYSAIGQYDRAIEAVEEGMKIANLPAGSVALASYYANLAAIYDLMPNHELKAIEYATMAYEIYEQEIEVDKSHLLILGHNLSVYYYQIGDYDNSLLYSKKSLSYGTYPKTLIHYANLLLQLQQYDEALLIYQNLLIEASKNFTDTNIYANPSKYETYNNNYLGSLILMGKAATFLKKGIAQENITDIEFAIVTAKIAEYIHTKLIEDLKGYEQARLSTNQEFKKRSDILLRAHLYLQEKLNSDSSFNDLFNTTEKRKSLLLLETLTPETLPDSIISKEVSLVKKIRDYEYKSTIAEHSDSIYFYQTAYLNKNLELEEHFKLIKQQFPKQVDNFHNINYPELSEIQTSLSSEQAIISYNKLDGNHIYILLITKQEGQVLKIEIDDNLFDKIESINQLLENPLLVQVSSRKAFIQFSYELYNKLVKPIVPFLVNKKKLIIIPEKELFYLPFEVLLSSNENKPFDKLDFLIKKFEISYQYSATIYHQLNQKKSIKDKSLLGFAPVFENGLSLTSASRSYEFIMDSLYKSIDDDKFVSLPNTAKEVQEIQKIVTQNKGVSSILLRRSATKQKLMEELKKPYQFVHLATHGLANINNPRLSALACFQNKKVEEVLLFANEIQLQNIQADLVILSSCESGIGRFVAGEGLIALNRSFIYAGANNVMFSLWKVNDEYTSELMINFYKAYFETQSYTAALRQAKLKMLENPITANPRYWAAFALIGE